MLEDFLIFQKILGAKLIEEHIHMLSDSFFGG